MGLIGRRSTAKSRRSTSEVASLSLVDGSQLSVGLIFEERRSGTRRRVHLQTPRCTLVLDVRDLEAFLVAVRAAAARATLPAPDPTPVEPSLAGACARTRA